MFAPEKAEKPKKDIWQAIEDNDLGALKALAQLPEFYVKVKNSWGRTPLLVASRLGRLDIVKWLLQAGGASTDEKDNDGITALLCAAYGGYLPMVQWLLEAGGASITEKDTAGTTALLFAADGGHLPVVQWLLEAGWASIAEKSGFTGRTALLWAATRGHLPVVQWLLETGGASIAEKSNAGMTALLIAASLGHLPMVQWLLEAGGASIAEKISGGMTALLCAAYGGYLPMVQWLLETGGASIAEKTGGGKTALLIAAFQGHLPMIQWLLEAGGASIAEKTSDGRTALLWAAFRGNLPVVQWLLHSGFSRLDECDHQKQSFWDRLSSKYSTLHNHYRTFLNQPNETTFAAICGYQEEGQLILRYTVLERLVSQQLCTLMNNHAHTLQAWYRSLSLYQHLYLLEKAHDVDNLDFISFLAKNACYPDFPSTLSIHPALLRSEAFRKKSWLYLMEYLSKPPLVMTPPIQVDVSKGKLTDIHLLQLAEALLNQPTLTHLILDGNALTFLGFKLLLRILKDHPSLEYLSVKASVIDDKNFNVEVEKEAIVSILPSTTALKQIVLSDACSIFTEKESTPTHPLDLKQLLESTQQLSEEMYKKHLALEGKHKEIEELEAQLQQVNDSNTQLSAKNEQLQVQLDQLYQEKNQLENELHQIDYSFQKLEKEREVYLQTIQSNIDTIEKDKQREERIVRNHQKQINDYEQKISELKSELEVHNKLKKMKRIKELKLLDSVYEGTLDITSVDVTLLKTARNEHLRNVLHQAVLGDQFELTKKLLALTLLDPTQMDSHNKPPVYYALNDHRFNLAELFLEHSPYKENPKPVEDYPHYREYVLSREIDKHQSYINTLDGQIQDYDQGHYLELKERAKLDKRTHENKLNTIKKELEQIRSQQPWNTGTPKAKTDLFKAPVESKSEEESIVEYSFPQP